MLRRHLQKIGSLLGLLAILMTTLAPTVSQALSAHDRLAEAMASYCSAGGDPADPAGAGESASHSSMLHWQACGYCGLLAHCPVAPSVPVLFARQTAFAHIAPVYTNAGTLPVAPVTSAQPRAPPVVP